MRISVMRKIAVIAAAVCLVACAGKNVSRQNERSTDALSDALYKKANAPVESRVADLLSRMTLEEKIGQMTQVCRDVLRKGDIADMKLGSVLSGGGSAPRDNSVQGWRAFVSSCQKEALSTRLGIPMLYGIDSVHGQNTLHNATIFPHNIGLGAAGDTDLVRRIGYAAAVETAATGIPWTFAPCVAVLRDPRWGRSYESFGSSTKPVTDMGAAFIDGWQSAAESGITMVACAKHFLGDGATTFGSSLLSGAVLDQGDMQETEEFVRTVLLPPYKAAVQQGVRTIMPSFSSWNGVKMHAHTYLLTDVLKGELGFTGFVISDWQALSKIDADYYISVVRCINAGVDMSMVPYDGREFIDTVTDAVEKGDISIARIDDAVTRILRVKFECGLFECPVIGENYVQSIRNTEHCALAREAAAKSVVVLKNDNILPLSDKEPVVYVAGRGADDIGIQCGGWTMTWQGKEGAITEGTTIFEGLTSLLPHSRVVKIDRDTIAGADASAVCVIVAGERPYAEFTGDSTTLALEMSDRLVITRALEYFDRVVLVIVSGRPLILKDEMINADAIAAAWLPGSEGSGVADVLCGVVKPQGKLPVAWPRSVAQLPYGRFDSGEEVPLYPVGYGLTW